MELGHIPIDQAEMRQVFTRARREPITVVDTDGDAVVVLSSEEFDKLCTTAELMDSPEIVARYLTYKEKAARGELELVSGEEADRLLRERRRTGT